MNPPLPHSKPRCKIPHWGVIPTIRSLALGAVVLSFVLGVSSCSTPREVGAWGDSKVYYRWGGGKYVPFYELKIPNIPTDSRRSYKLNISGLRVMHISGFSLAVQTPRAAMSKAKQTPGFSVNPAKAKYPVIRVTALHPGGGVIFTNTVGEGKLLWRPWHRDKNGYPVLISGVPGAQTRMDETGEVVLVIEILRPGEFPGQYMHIGSRDIRPPQSQANNASR